MYTNSTNIDFTYQFYFFKSDQYWGDDNLSHSELNDIYNTLGITDGVNIIYPMDEYCYEQMVIYGNLASTGTPNTGQYPSENNLDLKTRVNLPNKYAEFHWNLTNTYNGNLANAINYEYQKEARMLEHELGHNFGLSHSAPPHYYTNECLYSIMHQGGGSNCFADTDPWLPPSEVGDIIRLLSTSSSRLIISDDTYIQDKPITITDNQTWDLDLRIYSDIIIPSGTTLTITDIVRMPWKGKIIVKKGGKLIIDGGTITSYSENHLWQGIYIEGDPASKAAPPPYQGMLVATNGTIENAVCAITIGCAPSGDIDSGEGVGIPTGCSGGIVQCTGTLFINNKRSVKFDSYAFDNASYFKTCTFKADNNYLATAAGNTRPDDFIKLSNVKNVRFIASDFESNIGTGSEVKYGIYAQNSSFSVKDYSNTPSTFTNLSYGVYSLTSTGTLGQTIQDSEFDMCEKGIYISGSTGAIALSNTFTIPNAATSYGLYLDGCSGYHIENNSFAGTGSNASAVGCYVNNSGDDNNEIYRNYFEDLEVALVSLGENTDGASSGDGLCFVCNEFTDCSTDIKVTDICVGCPSGATAGVRNVQSDIDNQTVSAANKFLTGILGHIDFYNDGADIIYKYYQYNSAIEKPVQLGGDNYIITSSDSQNSCPSKLNGGGGSGEGADSDAPNSSVNTMWQTNNLRIDGNSSYTEPLIHASSSNKKNEESNLNSDKELVVLPNPNSGAFTITLPDNNGVLEVVNMQGISVYKATVDQQTIKLNLDHLSTGIYFVRYTYGENMEYCTTTKLQIVK